MEIPQFFTGLFDQYADDESVPVITDFSPEFRRKLERIQELVPDLSYAQKARLFEICFQSESMGLITKEIQILNQIINSNSSARLQERLQQENHDTDDLSGAFTSETFSEILALLIPHHGRLGLLIPTILAEMPYDKVPNTIKEIVSYTEIPSVLPRVDFNIRPWHENWWICNAFEGRLYDSLKTDAIVTANDALLVKFAGKISAICYKSISDTDGETFVRGGIYAPTDRATLNALKQAFDQGKPSIFLDKGTWALMRMYDQDILAETLRDINSYLVNLPDQFSGLIEGKKRKMWRRENNERH